MDATVTTARSCSAIGSTRAKEDVMPDRRHHIVTPRIGDCPAMLRDVANGGYSANGMRDALYAVAEELDAHLKHCGGDWLPIASAPHARAVGLFKDGKQYVGRWAQDPSTAKEAWIIGELGEGNRVLLESPTHWRELPAAPRRSD